MENFSKIKTAEIERKIGYTFNSKAYLEQAFTRSSYAKENPGTVSNEVLEFIGDSVLSALVTKHLTQRYELDKCIGKYYSCELDESELSEIKISLVQRASLSIATERLKLENYLLMGNNDVVGNVQNQASVKEDLFEAILGAVAIDSNWDMIHLEAVLHNLLDIDSILEDSGVNSNPNYVEDLSEKFNFFEFRDEPSICPALNIGCSLIVGDALLGETFYGYGNTFWGACQMASRRALKSTSMARDRKAIVLNAVGVPEFDRAVNQLQELFQKKIIPEPKYVFAPINIKANGNPEWSCSCVIEGIYEPQGEYIAASKSNAKKHAAFEALNYLIGVNLVKGIIENGMSTSEGTI